MIDIPNAKIKVIQPDGKGHYDTNGRYVEGKKTITETFASVQPLSGSEIQMLPEGRRNTEAIKIFSILKMFVSDEKNGRNASLVNYDEKTYEVHKVDNWSIGTDIPHYEITAIKIDGEGENAKG